MVALLRLLEAHQMLFQVLLLEEGGPVYASEHLVVRVALPVGTGRLHELEGAYLARARHMRARAEVSEAPVSIDADLGICGKVVDVLRLQALILEGIFRLCVRDDLAHEWLIACDDLRHLLFDGREVIGGEGSGQGEVVEEAVLGLRTEADLRTGDELLHSLCHHMSSRVAHDV